jgi:hypothetical protein
MYIKWTNRNANNIRKGNLSTQFMKPIFVLRLVGERPIMHQNCLSIYFPRLFCSPATVFNKLLSYSLADFLNHLLLLSPFTNSTLVLMVIKYFVWKPGQIQLCIHFTTYVTNFIRNNLLSLGGKHLTCSRTIIKRYKHRVCLILTS